MAARRSWALPDLKAWKAVFLPVDTLWGHHRQESPDSSRPVEECLLCLALGVSDFVPFLLPAFLPTLEPLTVLWFLTSRVCLDVEFNLERKSNSPSAISFIH